MTFTSLARWADSIWEVSRQPFEPDVICKIPDIDVVGQSSSRHRKNVQESRQHLVRGRRQIVASSSSSCHARVRETTSTAVRHSMMAAVISTGRWWTFERREGLGRAGGAERDGDGEGQRRGSTPGDRSGSGLALTISMAYSPEWGRSA